MLYHEIVEKLKRTYESADVRDIKEHFAYQFNVSGEGEGAFYLNIYESRVSVMPYEYFDRNVLLFLSDEILMDVFEGRLLMAEALERGLITIEGDVEELEPLETLIERVAAPEKRAGAKTQEAAKAAEEAAEQAAREARERTEAAEQAARETRERAEAAEQAQTEEKDEEEPADEQAQEKAGTAKGLNKKAKAKAIGQGGKNLSRAERKRRGKKKAKGKK